MGDNGWCYEYELNDQKCLLKSVSNENFVDNAKANLNKYHQQWNAPHTSQDHSKKSPNILLLPI